ncbi:MAG: hypothetical protein ACYSTJ_09155 [Planctomycetota bacterium]|jgi:hypothetical protein
MKTQKNVPNPNHSQHYASSLSLSFWVVAVCLTVLLSLASATVAQESVDLLGAAGGPPDKDPNKHADKIKDSW